MEYKNQEERIKEIIRSVQALYKEAEKEDRKILFFILVPEGDIYK